MMLLWVWYRVTALVFVPDTPGGENDPLQRLRERSGAQREQHRLVELRRETGRVRRLLHEVRRTLATVPFSLATPALFPASLQMCI